MEQEDLVFLQHVLEDFQRLDEHGQIPKFLDIFARLCIRENHEFVTEKTLTLKPFKDLDTTMKRKRLEQKLSQLFYDEYQRKLTLFRKYAKAPVEEKARNEYREVREALERAVQMRYWRDFPYKPNATLDAWLNSKQETTTTTTTSSMQSAEQKQQQQQTSKPLQLGDAPEKELFPADEISCMRAGFLKKEQNSKLLQQLLEIKNDNPVQEKAKRQLFKDLKRNFEWIEGNVQEVKGDAKEFMVIEGFAALIGMANERNKLTNSILLPFMQEPLYKRQVTKSPEGTLLYGPPGTGKTELMKRLREEMVLVFTDYLSEIAMFKDISKQQLLQLTDLAVSVISGDAGKIRQHLVGQSEKKVTQMYMCAYNLAHFCFDKIEEKAKTFQLEEQVFKSLMEEMRVYSILYLDEFDSLVSQRDSGGGGGDGSAEQANVVNMFLQESTNPLYRNTILQISATNLIDKIDEAIRRRFPHVVFVDFPDDEARFSFCFHKFVDIYVRYTKTYLPLSKDKGKEHVQKNLEVLHLMLCVNEDDKYLQPKEKSDYENPKFGNLQKTKMSERLAFLWKNCRTHIIEHRVRNNNTLWTVEEFYKKLKEVLTGYEEKHLYLLGHVLLTCLWFTVLTGVSKTGVIELLKRRNTERDSNGQQVFGYFKDKKIYGSQLDSIEFQTFFHQKLNDYPKVKGLNDAWKTVLGTDNTMQDVEFDDFTDKYLEFLKQSNEYLLLKIQYSDQRRPFQNLFGYSFSDLDVLIAQALSQSAAEKRQLRQNNSKISKWSNPSQFQWFQLNFRHFVQAFQENPPAGMKLQNYAELFFFNIDRNYKVPTDPKELDSNANQRYNQLEDEYEKSLKKTLPPPVKEESPKSRWSLFG